jgi:hypothetical protein
MIPFYTQEEYNQAKSADKLPLKCYHCGNTFCIEKKLITYSLNPENQKVRGRGKYCSKECSSASQSKSEILNCGNCNAPVKRLLKEKNKSKSSFSFCSKSCAAIYNNTHKQTGTRRSKLEAWLEEQLKSKYSNLDILFNDKTAIGSELDIYVPSLKVAFELNGIFHYKPIYGEKKFIATQNNDSKKKESCDNLKISLHVLDISGQTRFTPKSSETYLNYICQEINSKV